MMKGHGIPGMSELSNSGSVPNLGLLKRYLRMPQGDAHGVSLAPAKDVSNFFWGTQFGGQGDSSERL
jgi:hypothetical protein